MAVWILAPLAGSRLGDTVRCLFVACLLYVGLATCKPAFCAAQDMPRASIVDLPLEWQDDHGAALRFSQWHGKTILLTMAYSTCREVCSFALHRLEELQESADTAHRPIEVIVISYDPSVDSPRSWSAYRTHHHLLRRNWHFLTGDAATTKQFAAAFDFPSWRYDELPLHLSRQTRAHHSRLQDPDGRA